MPPLDPLAQLAEVAQRHRAGRPVWEWFDHRVKTHHEAARGGQSHSPGHGAPLRAEPDAIVHSLQTLPSATRRVIYVHVPYCPSICSFCAFFRRPLGEADLDAYVAAVVRQVRRYGRTAWAEAGPVSAVYFGGGTPTLLSARQLASILAALRAAFPLAEEAEVTIESRLQDVDGPYMRALVDQGVTRVSFGVQSFDTATRRHVGRRSSREEIERTIAATKNAGVRCISVDLIYNLPRQTPEVWRDDLRLLRDLPVSGTSTYALIPFPQSVLQKKIASGAEPPLGGLDSEFAYYAEADARLTEAGWQLYSPFHRGRRGEETNLYNTSRLGLSDVLGLGAGGGGRLAGCSYMGSPNIEKFVEDQGNDRDDNAFVSPAEAGSRHGREVFGLAEGPGFEAPPDYVRYHPRTSAVLDALLGAGLAVLDGSAYSLTLAGRFWAYNVTALLAASLAPTAPSSPHSPERNHRMSAVPSSNMAAIKAGIWDIHEGVANGEKQAAPDNDNIMKGTLARYKYVANLGQRYLMQATFERVMLAHVPRSTFLAAVVTPEQFHAGKAASDLRFFGVDPDRVQPLPSTQRMIDFFQATAERDPRLLLATHYVVEGSNNGAMFIAKAVKKAYDLEGTDGTWHLQPYGNAIRDKWRAFGEAFDSLAIDTGLMAELIRVGRETFRHMDAIAVESYRQPEAIPA